MFTQPVPNVTQADYNYKVATLNATALHALIKPTDVPLPELGVGLQNENMGNVPIVYNHFKPIPQVTALNPINNIAWVYNPDYTNPAETLGKEEEGKTPFFGLPTYY